VFDDSAKETLARLKKASDALDAVQDASDITAQEIARDKRAHGTVASVTNGVHKPKRQPKHPA
jgi:hypothetical protein